MKRALITTVFLFALLPSVLATSSADFIASDPWIYRDDEAGVYRLYLLTSERHPEGAGVEMRISGNLTDWSEPKRVLDVPDIRACDAPWAPEMHAYNGKYYMFVTISTKRGAFPELECLEPGDWKKLPRPPRGTWVYRADSPEGPFSEWSEGPIPPAEWSTLDGTLFVEDGRPYMVFCHEWTQVRDGKMCAVEMSADLKAAVGRPFDLFRASVRPGAPEGPLERHVTDGPFLFRSKNGSLLMTWSSYSPSGYCVIVTRSESGKLAGPWTRHERIFSADGGHGMIFRAFDGRLMLALHTPNSPGSAKRLKVVGIEDLGDTLRIAGQGVGHVRAGTFPPTNSYCANRQ